LLVRLSDHPAIFSAPHAKRHIRDGAPKLRDTNTAVLAFEAARLAGARAVVVTALLPEDPNWDADTKFRRQISMMLHDTPGFLIDIHGMTNDHGPDVVIGTSGRRSSPGLVACVESALALHKLSFETRTDGAMSASDPRTMTSWALSCGTPAIQLEFARRVRIPAIDPERFSAAVEALAEMAQWREELPTPDR
jgi:threonine dehydrogenase-like Zn-dependent dehydrogenase